jgi:hypothetical protein
METIPERVDFGIGEETDFPVDWAIFAGGHEAMAGPYLYHRACGSGRVDASAIEGQTGAG